MELFNHLGGDGLLSGKSDTGELVSSARISKKIAHGQRVLEGANLDRRKALYKYSDLVEQQRQVIHQLRDDILLGDGAHQFKSKVARRWQSLGPERLQFVEHALLLLHSFELGLPLGPTMLSPLAHPPSQPAPGHSGRED